MPLAQIYIGPSHSPEVKQELIGKITQAITGALGPTKLYWIPGQLYQPKAQNCCGSIY